MLRRRRQRSPGLRMRREWQRRRPLPPPRTTAASTTPARPAVARPRPSPAARRASGGSCAASHSTRLVLGSPTRPGHDRRVRALRVPHLRRRPPDGRPGGDRALRAHGQGEPRVPRRRAARRPSRRPRSRARAVRRVGAAARLGLRPARLPAQPRERGPGRRRRASRPARHAPSASTWSRVASDELRAAGVADAGRGCRAMSRRSPGLDLSRCSCSVPARSPSEPFVVLTASGLGRGVRDGDRKGAARRPVDALSCGTVEFCLPFG